MALALTIQLFGGFQVTLADQPVPGLSAPRTQRLLAYLILHRQTAQPRQRVAFHLWPNSSATQAKANLRKELSYLRRVLPQPETLLWVDAQTLQWQPTGPVSLDVASFEHGLQAAEQTTAPDQRCALLKQALGYYAAPLLPDHDDDWIGVERERLQRLYRFALEQLIRDLEDQRDYTTALTYAQPLLAADPLNEAAYQIVMRLQGAAGDRASALQVYHQCMTTLQDELGILPSATTRQLYEQLLREETLPSSHTQAPLGSPAAGPPGLGGSRGVIPAPPLPLVGREAAWAEVQRWADGVSQPDSALHSTRGSTAEVLLILGEPGIGKTRLLEELRTLTQPRHMLWGQGFAAEMMRPYGIWIDALRSLTQANGPALPTGLGVLLPELGAITPPTDLSHLLDTVVQGLSQWASQAPLLLVFDDVQWLDEASAALLHYAIRVLRPLPVGFALAARSGELAQNRALSQVLQALRREQRLHTLDLPPLDCQQTADLLHHAQPPTPVNVSPAAINQVFIDSGGNPLFALELARSWGQHQAPTTSTLEDLIRDRLHQLDDASRDFLPWAAALGRRFNPATVAHIANYPLTQLLTVVEQLEQQGIIRPNSSLEPSATLDQRGSYDFAHDVLRQLVYQQISLPRRQLMHQQIAHQLQAQANTALASEIAYHAALGGDPALATTSALVAAERCLQVFAYHEARTLAQQGLQHSQALEPAQRLGLQAQLWQVCILAGLTPDLAPSLEAKIQEILHASKALGLAEAETSALETLTILHFEQSNFTALHQHSLRMAEVNRFTSPTTAARMLAHSGSCLAEIGRDVGRAEALLLEAQSLADRVGLECIDIYHGLGCVHRHHGRYDEARSQLQRAWRLAQTQQDHWREGLALSYLAMTELESGHPTAALPYGQAMLTVAEQIAGEGSETAVALGLIALAHYQMQAHQAEAAVETAILALQRVDAKRPLAYLLMGAAAVDRQQGRLPLAVQRAEQALSLTQTIHHPSDLVISWVELIQGLQALGQTHQAQAQTDALRQALPTDDLSLRAKLACQALSVNNA